MASYTMDLNHASYDGLSNLSTQSLYFYWIDGGVREVDCTISASNQTYELHTTFNVVKPTADFSTTSTGSVVVRLNPDILAFLDPTNTAEGMVYGASIEAPFTASRSADDQVALLQLVNTNRSWTLDDANSTPGGVTTDGQYALDSIAADPFVKKENIQEDAVFGINGYIQAADSPSQALLSTEKSVSVNDSFHTYVMYRPGGDFSIWVPISVMTWSWEGAAIKGANGWTLNGEPSHTTSAAGTDTSLLPVWSIHVQDLENQ